MSESNDPKPKQGEAPAADPNLAVMSEMLKTMQAMQAKANPVPVLPDSDAFKAGKDYYVVGPDGDKYRHGLLPDGEATLLDNKLRPVDA